jgi:RNA polymerase sigma-70 factor (ECF subfamily)
MDTPAKASSSSGLTLTASGGDTAAFVELFNAYKVRIYSLCLRMTNNSAEAEDLTQDAFLQVFRTLPTFRGESALSTWLYRIAVNTVLMHLRKRMVCRASFDDCEEGDESVLRRQYGCKDSRLSGAVDRIAIIRALQELPSGYRTMFLLHEVQGYEHQEIAKLLDCSAGNSKSQLHKAKVRIRQILTRTMDARGTTDAPARTDQGDGGPLVREATKIARHDGRKPPGSVLESPVARTSTRGHVLPHV